MFLNAGVILTKTNTITHAQSLFETRNSHFCDPIITKYKFSTTSHLLSFIKTLEYTPSSFCVRDMLIRFYKLLFLFANSFNFILFMHFIFLTLSIYLEQGLPLSNSSVVIRFSFIRYACLSPSKPFVPLYHLYSF